MNKLRIYIGFDRREKVAYDVSRRSILKRTSKPKTTTVSPVELDYLKAAKLLTRPVDTRDGKLWCPISQAPMATEFAISRFAVPFLARKGWALFVDCDVVCLADIAELFALADPKYAVMCVKHNQVPVETVKMDGQVQTSYTRKNWSSVVLWNCDHPANKALTLDALNTWPGRDLHAFKWLSDDLIGALPKEWNLLVGVTQDWAQVPSPKILHYTLGGPWLPGWEPKPGDDIWLKEAEGI